MARILITGASGFIGGYLVEQALEHGHDVCVAVRANSDLTRLQDPRLGMLQLSLNNEAALANELRAAGRFDWVIHNAGVTKALLRSEYQVVNAQNTHRLATALLGSGLLPDKFMFVSSLAALGPAPAGQAMIRPDQPARPLTAYGESKKEAERLLESLPAGFPWLVVQPTAVYGPWERDILTFIRLANKGLELTIGRKSQRLSFIHAADVAAAIFHLLENPATPLQRKIILSDGHGYTTEDLGAAVTRALGGKKTLKIRLPLGLVRQVAGVAETIGHWQKKPSPLNRDKIPELAAENWHCDATNLLETLKFKPAFDLYQGMQNTVDWYRQAGWL